MAQNHAQRITEGFNSLFEMLAKDSYLRDAATEYAGFNSLFEMRQAQA